jgi:uncharacterized Fe-S cluster protein YjdI
MKEEIMQKEYSNGDITVIWESEKCQHSGKCVQGLPQVFRPREQPWIKIEQANSDDIVATVHKCPSGALSIKGE